MPCSQRFDQVLSSWNEVLLQKQKISRSSYEEDNQLDSDRKHRSYVYSSPALAASKDDPGIHKREVNQQRRSIRAQRAGRLPRRKLRSSRTKHVWKQTANSRKRKGPNWRKSRTRPAKGSTRRNVTRKRSTPAKPNSCNWRKLTGYERSRPFFFRIPPVLSLHNPCPGKFFIRRRQAYKRLLQASPA